MDIASLVGVVGGILGLIGLLSAALVVARSSIAKGTISLLEENQAALKSRLETVESENRMLRERVGALEHTKDELFQQVKSLPEFTKITTTLSGVDNTLQDLCEDIQTIKKAVVSG